MFSPGLMLLEWERGERKSPFCSFQLGIEESPSRNFLVLLNGIFKKLASNTLVHGIRKCGQNWMLLYHTRDSRRKQSNHKTSQLEPSGQSVRWLSLLSFFIVLKVNGTEGLIYALRRS